MTHASRWNAPFSVETSHIEGNLPRVTQRVFSGQMNHIASRIRTKIKCASILLAATDRVVSRIVVFRRSGLRTAGVGSDAFFRLPSYDPAKYCLPPIWAEHTSISINNIGSLRKIIELHGYTALRPNYESYLMGLLHNNGYSLNDVLHAGPSLYYLLTTVL